MDGRTPGRPSRPVMVLNRLLDNLVQYLEARFDLFRLEAEEAAASALAHLARGAVVAVLALLMVVFVGCGLVQLCNVWLQSPYAGYFVVGGVFGLGLLGVLSAPGGRLLRRKSEAAVGRLFEKPARPAADEHGPVPEA